MAEPKRLRQELLPRSIAEAHEPAELDDQLVSPFAPIQADAGPSILIVGSEGTGKRTLVALLRRAYASVGQVHESRSLRIFTTSSLPLPRDGAAKANAFDYVVLLVNMLDGLSIDVAGGAMAHLQHETIFGQCCIVCTHADMAASASVLPDNLTSLARALQVPVFYADLLRTGEPQAHRILKLVSVAVGALARSGATPSMLVATQSILVQKTSAE